MSVKDGISNSSALQYFIDKADADLGKNVGDKTDCTIYTKDQLNRQFDYYQAKAREYILANFTLYVKIHLIKAAPFFLQSGNIDIYSAYTGAAPKVDLTGSLMAGKFGVIRAYLTNLNTELVIYLSSLLFWILLTLALLFSFFYSLFKDRQKFPLFFILWPILIYNALLISPFANVRYRLPFYIFFFLALVYCGGLLLKSLRDVNDIMLYVKKNIRR